VIGIDRDADAIEAAGHKLREFGSRFRAVKGNFSEIGSLVGELNPGGAEAFLYDLGVSSFQLDSTQRGFSYREGVPLDMRMDRSQALDAATVVNSYAESRLIEILFAYGEERFSRRIAGAIVARREKRPFNDAGDLAETVKAAIPAATRRTGPHPARRAFQALRIEVNGELEALSRSLGDAVEMTKPSGRIGVISYHSLEDRIAKNVFREGSVGCVCPVDLAVCLCGRQAELRPLTRKPVRASPEEVAANRRAESARLRTAEKLGKAA